MNPILPPMLTILLLQVVIFIAMTVARARIIAAYRGRLEQIATRDTMAPLLTGAARRLSDNMANLLETPLLFHILCLLLVATGNTEPLYTLLAWGFVVFRVIHSAIHCTYNDMRHRICAFALALFCFIIMLGYFIAGTL